MFHIRSYDMCILLLKLYNRLKIAQAAGDDNVRYWISKRLERQRNYDTKTQANR